MKIELAHSLNVRLDKVVTEQIKAIQQRLVERFKERRELSTPHLSVLLRFATSSDTKIFIEKLVDEFSGEKFFSLAFAGFSVSSSGEYIFLNFDERSTEILLEINLRAKRATNGIGTGGMGGTPARYSYLPHVSLIKLLPEESVIALEMLHDELAGVPLHVEALNISVDDASILGTIKVVREIPLHD